MGLRSRNALTTALSQSYEQLGRAAMQPLARTALERTAKHPVTHSKLTSPLRTPILTRFEGYRSIAPVASSDCIGGNTSVSCHGWFVFLGEKLARSLFRDIQHIRDVLHSQAILAELACGFADFCGRCGV